MIIMMMVITRMTMTMNDKNAKTNPLLDSKFESGLGPDRADPELRDPDPAK